MAKKSYCGINNIARNIPNTGYCGVNDVARRLVKGYIGDSQGVARIFWDRSLWRREADIPYSFYRGKAVVYRGKIHLLGCNEYPTNHYSWDGTTWVQESTLPYTMDWGDAVVYNDKIHIFGGVGNTTDINYAHWAWDGTLWTQLANLPIVMNGINYAHIFRNKILLASTGYGRYSSWQWLCWWDGTQWTRDNSGVGNDGVYSTAILDDLIYMLGNSGTGGTKYFYTDGANPSGWVGTLPYPFYLGYALRYGGKIHMLGSHARTPSYSYPYTKNHYSFDGQNFEEVSEMPYPFYNNPAVVFKNRIHIFGSGDSNYRTEHWSYGLTPTIPQNVLSALYYPDDYVNLPITIIKFPFSLKQGGYTIPFSLVNNTAPVYVAIFQDINSGYCAPYMFSTEAFSYKMSSSTYNSNQQLHEGYTYYTSQMFGNFTPMQEMIDNGITNQIDGLKQYRAWDVAHILNEGNQNNAVVGYDFPI